MNTSNRLALVVSLLFVAVLPGLTGHALLTHLHWLRSQGGEQWGQQALMLTVLALTLLTLVPLTLVARATWAWKRAARILSALTAYGKKCSFAGIDYVSIPGEQIAFFTAGLRRPVIYATKAAERDLPAGMFHAALLHERAHVRRQHVRWLALLAVVESAFAWSPWARDSIAALRTATEREADGDALKAGARRRDLFEAIVAASTAPVTTAALAQAGVTARLEWLAGHGYMQPSVRRGLALFLGAVSAPAVLAHVLLWAGVAVGICGASMR